VAGTPPQVLRLPNTRAPAREKGGTARAVLLDIAAGDVVLHQAAITRDLGYRPTHSVREGMRETVRWYANQPRFSVGSTADGTASAQADMASM
jgi:hypothetical protein